MNYQDGIVKQTEFFTTAELAQKLKMNVQVVTRKVQAGEIRAYKIGKEWRIPEQAVMEWLENRTNRPHESLKASGPFHQSGNNTIEDAGNSLTEMQQETTRAQGHAKQTLPRAVSPAQATSPITKATIDVPSPTVKRNGAAITNGGATGGTATRRYLLEYILAQFEPHRSYLDHEVDLIIRRHGQDTEIVKAEMLAANMLTASQGKFSRRLDYQLAST